MSSERYLPVRQFTNSESERDLVCLYLFLQRTSRTPNAYTHVFSRRKCAKCTRDDFAPDELHVLFQQMPDTAATAMAIDSVSGADGGKDEQKDKARTGNPPAPVESSKNAGGTDDARASQRREGKPEG